MFGGLALIVVLIVYQFRARRPLLTVRTMLTSSIPVAGVGVALFAAAASVAATALTANVLLQTYSPVRVGLLYLPELGGAIVMAFVFGIVITRRAMHYLPLVGMALLAAGIVVFRIALPANQPLVLVGSALTGLALGATVAPALFVAGFSLQSASLQRVFAIIELLRAVAAFMVAPILAHFAVHGGGRSGRGHRLRALDRLRARDRRRRLRCGDLRAERSPTADARPGRVPRRRLPRLVLAAAAGPNPVRTCRPRLAAAEHAPARTTSSHRDDCRRRPGRCSSPTTDPNSPRSRSRRPRPSWRLGDDAAGRVRLAARRRRIHPDRRQTLRRRPGHRGTASRRADRRPRGVAGRRGRIPGAQRGRRGGADLEGHRRRPPTNTSASLIVLGPHRRSGLLGHLQGSVAAAVVAHCSTPVLIVPSGPMTNSRTSTADSGRSVRTGQ